MTIEELQPHPRFQIGSRHGMKLKVTNLHCRWYLGHNETCACFIPLTTEWYVQSFDSSNYFTLLGPWVCHSHWLQVKLNLRICVWIPAKHSTGSFFSSRLFFNLCCAIVLCNVWKVFDKKTGAIKWGILCSRITFNYFTWP